MALGVLLVVLASVLAGCTPRPQAETQFLDDLNRRRSEHGLAALSPSPGLQAAARNHAINMMAKGLAHAPDLTPGSLASSRRFGENVGRGSSVSSIADAFWASDSHRNQILGQYTHVGIGVFEDREAQLWVVVRFEG